MPEELPTSLQESLLALLSFNREGGAAVAAQVRPEHFDTPYQEIATQLLGYWRQYGRPPGAAHLDDIFGVTLQTGERSTRLRRLLTGITSLANGINADYLVRRASDHVRAQTLKTAVLRAGELYQGGGADNIAQVEQVLYAALRASTTKFDSGTFLNDPDRALSFLDRDRSDNTYTIGIPDLDNFGVGATIGQLLLYIAPKNTGKTWFCVHMGRQCLMQQGRAVHISLEMDEEEVLPRYMQNMFGASWEPDPYLVSVLELDDNEHFAEWKVRRRKPKFSFADQDVKSILRTRIHSWGARMGSIVVKRFPSGQLTIDKLSAYLDYLESVEKFIPTMLIVDYPYLMKMDRRHLRTEMGGIFVDLRGLGVDRRMAVVTPAQGQRSAMTARKVRSIHASEDISQVFTADNVLTYSQTPGEARRGLARLELEHARHAPKGLEFIITQAYAAGQYVLSSARVNSAYWDKLTKLEERGDRDNGDDDDDD